MKVIQIEQGSADWHALRRCTVTGTKLDAVMGTPQARVSLIAELIAEGGTEQTKRHHMSLEMERGHDEEVFALKLFEKQTGKKVTHGGMWRSDKYVYLACSPDGSIEEKNGDILEAVEVKNPDSKNKIFYQLTNMVGMEELGLGTWSRETAKNPISVFKPSSKNPFLGIPPDYKWQCVDYFLVNEKLQRLHFVIHDARFIDADAKLDIITIERDDPELQTALKEVEEALVKFREDWMKWQEIVLPSKF